MSRTGGFPSQAGNSAATALQAQFNRGLALHQQGNLTEAERIYKNILRLQQNHFDALHLLGVIALQTEQTARGVDLITKAIRLNPTVAGVHSNLGNALRDLNRPEEAIASYDRAIALQPDYAEAHNNRGNALRDLNRPAEALASYDRALALRPNYAETHNNRGNALRDLKRFDEALASYDRAIALRPNYAEAHSNRGNALRSLRRHEAALASYDHAIALKPGYVEAYNNRGNALRDLKRFAEALASYDKAIALQPGYAEAYTHRGAALQDLERFDEALASHDKAIALNPGLADAHSNRGVTLLALKRPEEALASYDKALALDSGLAKAWLGRGNVLCEICHFEDSLAAYDKALALQSDLATAWFGRGQVEGKISRHEDALVTFDRALALDPDLAEAWLCRSNSLLETNRTTEAINCIDKALSIKPDFREALTHRVFALDFAEGVDIEGQQEARKLWWRRIGAKIAEQCSVRHLNDRDPNRRLRIGYVSADFRVHSAALCFQPVLVNHDKSRFEITCYSSSAPEDDYTEHFRRAADRWHNVTRMSDSELCAQIQADQIDILVDLSGYTSGNRLGVFACKPAPIQVTAWGHATGTGMPTVDYLLSDPVTCPPAERHLFAEKVVDLPSVITIAPLPDPMPPSDPPVLSRGFVTFGVFNRTTKLSDAVIALWARILHAVPRSRILLKHHGFDVPAMRTRQAEKFAAHGIATDRVAFLGTTPRRDHLATFKDVDISLDPFPQNGGISTWESMQLGVPVIAMLGNTIPSRVAGGILTSVGMGDWVADSDDGYLDVAVKFASMPAHLKELRHELPARLANSAAGNSLAYTKAVEAAYRTMWAHYCR